MRALQVIGPKRPPELRDVPEPEPGPGQVLLRVGGAGACHSDLHLLHDFDDLPFDLPFTLGHETAGWVESVGAGVAGVEVGEPVAVHGPWGCGRCARCRQGMDNNCEQPGLVAGGGLGADGGMAELMLVPSARMLVPLGDLDPVDAAPLTDAGLSPYHAVRRALPLLVPGSHAVVIGVGGLGHLAVQLLEVLSATTVIAVDVRPSALDLARQVGAHHAVSAGDLAALEVRERTGGKGADLVLDFVGSDETLALAAAVSRPLAQIRLLGVAGGSYPFGFFTLPYEVSMASSYWGSVTELMEVLDLAAAGHLRVHVERFDLDDAPRAYERLEAGQVDGRAVVVPPPR